MNLARLALKTALLFILLNVVFVVWTPVEAVDNVSLYNTLLPGRSRFPFGENPQQAYNLSLYNLDAMFASHIAAAKPAEDEYRVFLIGDSSVWGTLLKPDETLAGQLNGLNLSCAGRPARFYNLGYPTISLTKDLMILDQSVRYDPDQFIWLFTLESFIREKQLDSPIAANNPQRIRALIQSYDLALDSQAAQLADPALLERTIVGQRRPLADLLRLQLYGVMWAATGIDQDVPQKYTPAQRDFEEVDLEYHGLQPPVLPANDLALETLSAGVKVAGDRPVLFVNEPMLISQGQGSQERYNFFYPRWAYDQYRDMLVSALPAGNGYLDLWDIVPEAEFTNSAIHLTPAGEALLAERVAESFCSESPLLD